VAILLQDAQTSGGLLLATPAPALDMLLAGLDARGVLAAVIGRVEGGTPGRVVINP
jgi:hypothetical protein